MNISSFLSGTMMDFSKSPAVVAISLIMEFFCFQVFAATRFRGSPAFFLKKVCSEALLRPLLSLLLLGANLALQTRFWPISLHCLSQMLLWISYICLQYSAGWHSAVFESSIFCLLLELGKSLYRGGTMAYLLYVIRPDLTQIQLCVITYSGYLLYLSLLIAIFIYRGDKEGSRNLVSSCSIVQTAGLLFPLLLYLFIRQFQSGLTAEASPDMHLSLEIICVAVAVCAVIVTANIASVLRAQNSRNELLMQKMLAEQQHSQYLIQKEAVDAIGRKYHDLKHYLTALESDGSSEEMKRFAREMKKEIEPIETIQETGNEVMDVLLAQRIRECQEKEIRFIPYIDGRNLGAISTIDLCTLFGNAMDNAIEASLRIGDPQMREISVKIENYGELIIFRFVNRCETAAGNTSGGYRPAGNEKDTAEEGGGFAVESFPTTKEDAANHGYGLPSIRAAVEKYGGSVTVNEENGVFELVAVIPV